MDSKEPVAIPGAAQMLNTIEKLDVTLIMLLAIAFHLQF